MAHDIKDEDHFVERSRPDAVGFQGRDHTRAWHSLGTVRDADDPSTVEEFFRAAGADLVITKQPQGILIHGNEFVPTDKYLLYREPYTFNGTVREGGLLPNTLPVAANYTPLENMAVARMLEPLHKEWPIETVGVLNEGSAMFAAMFGGRFAIKGGDEHEMFLMVQNFTDGKNATRIDLTPWRAVCANTVRLAMSAASVSVKIPHGSRAGDELSFWTEVIPQVKVQSQAVQDTLEALANTPATNGQVMQIFTTAFKSPGTKDIVKYVSANKGTLTLSDEAKLLAETYGSAAQAQLDRTTRIWGDMWKQYEIHGDTAPETAGTLYAAAHAANYVACHRASHEGTLDKSVVFGARADESMRAFGAAVDILEGVTA